MGWVAHGQIAYVTALRGQLRGTAGDAAGGPANPALSLLTGQSTRIFQAYRDGVLTGLDNFQMETALAAVSTQQALAERIAMQPVPRTYDIFSRYLVHLYAVVFPFAVIGTLPAHRWLVIPATLIIAFAFRMVERIGAVVEAPFGNTRQDVPLTAIGTLLERDLLDLVGETDDRPPAPVPVGGYLW